LFPTTARTTLRGVEATRVAVFEHLPQHRWVHFGCHGDQNLNSPSEGGLLLHDGVLTVADVSAGQFRGDFAGLAACKTAVGGVDLLDESITLAAALHYTGYRHVVAALWSVHDRTTATVFDDLYSALVENGRLHPERAAIELHRVVLALRDRAPLEPRRWTPFTHTGP
jgi:CHAT domain-containing protein